MPSINLTISLREAACVDYRMPHRTYRSQRLPLYAWTYMRQIDDVCIVLTPRQVSGEVPNHYSKGCIIE
jgi:hypothetical protein